MAHWIAGASRGASGGMPACERIEVIRGCLRRVPAPAGLSVIVSPALSRRPCSSLDRLSNWEPPAVGGVTIQRSEWFLLSAPSPSASGQGIGGAPSRCRSTGLDPDVLAGELRRNYVLGLADAHDAELSLEAWSARC